MTATREIETRLDSNRADPNLWRLSAECQDEITQILIGNPAHPDPSPRRVRTSYRETGRSRS